MLLRLSPWDELFQTKNHKKAIQYNWTVRRERDTIIWNLWSDAASFVFFSLYYGCCCCSFFSSSTSLIALNVNRALVWSRMSMPIKIPKITRKMCMCFRRREKTTTTTIEEQEKNEKNYGKKKRNVHKSLRSFIVVVVGDGAAFLCVDVCVSFFPSVSCYFIYFYFISSVSFNSQARGKRKRGKKQTERMLKKPRILNRRISTKITVAAAANSPNSNWEK